MMTTLRRSTDVTRLRDLVGRLIMRAVPGRLANRQRQDGRGPAERDVVARLETLCRSLLSGKGEASGTALAADIMELYELADAEQRVAFFVRLAEGFGPDWPAARAAWAAHEKAPSHERFRTLVQAIEPARQELFRRINRATGGTAALVRLREDVLKALRQRPALRCVDDDLEHLFQSWFNRGFLVLQRIDWSTPADILERIIRYEAVHQIGGWGDLRRRLQPPDRRCYAFFHPALASDPVIFVEVALTDAIPDSIQTLLAEDRVPMAPQSATTAVFYSISNCQPGLQGVSFGNFLIKQVVEELAHEFPGLSTFVTLSPVPGFSRWLAANDDARDVRARLDDPNWKDDGGKAARLKSDLMPLAAEYFLKARDARGRPVDPVARFHLGNGARLERLCWLGDTSAKGMRESAGLMVNYLYDLAQVETNHEAFANDGLIAASKNVRRLDAPASKGKALASAPVG
ncbi:malonyl-CoA decarboxylase [Sphingomonas sp. Root710]|uniref:malonyl-CoA decarboxylase n=1 Tax=Sphingomonas sp. Root710 TaxID=1736594 RepID=UPI000A7564E6|nr:malonyl-CoA decarboxylase [Sphingomonas sp. Root710]